MIVVKRVIGGGRTLPALLQIVFESAPRNEAPLHLCGHGDDRAVRVVAGAYNIRNLHTRTMSAAAKPGERLQFTSGDSADMPTTEDLLYLFHHRHDRAVSTWGSPTKGTAVTRYRARHHLVISTPAWSPDGQYAAKRDE